MVLPIEANQLKVSPMSNRVSSSIEVFWRLNEIGIGAVGYQAM